MMSAWRAMQILSKGGKRKPDGRVRLVSGLRSMHSVMHEEDDKTVPAHTKSRLLHHLLLAKNRLHTQSV